MAAVTTAVVAGAGVAMSFYGSQQAAAAQRKAAKINAADAEWNARMAAEKAAEDERQFRLSFKRDQGRNVASVGASGVRMEGSPLEVMADNVIQMERDALNIRKFGDVMRDKYMRDARNIRSMGRAQSEATQIAGAADLLKGAADTYSTGAKSGA